MNKDPKAVELITKIVLQTATENDFYAFSRKFSDMQILLEFSDLSPVLREFGFYSDRNVLNPDDDTQYIDINTLKGSDTIYTIEEGINNSYAVDL